METTATTKGQVVIPSSVRRKLGIKTGTRIQVELDEDNAQIILTPITREYIHSLRGKFRGAGCLRNLRLREPTIGSVKTEIASVFCRP